MEKKFLIKVMNKDLYLKYISNDGENQAIFTDCIKNAWIYDSKFEAEKDLFSEYSRFDYGIYSII